MQRFIRWCSSSGNQIKFSRNSANMQLPSACVGTCWVNSQIWCGMHSHTHTPKWKSMCSIYMSTFWHWLNVHMMACWNTLNKKLGHSCLYCGYCLLYFVEHDLNNFVISVLKSCTKFLCVPYYQSEETLCSFVGADVDLPTTRVFAFHTDEFSIKLLLPSPG